MLTLTERADIDRLMASTEEMLRNRFDLRCAREALLEAEQACNSLRLRIHKLSQRQYELAGQQVRP